MILLSIPILSIAQNDQANNDKKPLGFTTSNPFKNDVFIKNSGQFNSWIKSELPIKYVINNTNKIFFTQQGIYIKLEKLEELSEEEKEEREKFGEDNEFSNFIPYWVKIKWLGCNPNAKLIASESTQGYYTYGEKGFEHLQFNGYKKLLYKELYPGIDVEYTIPDKGGIKYSIIVRPGADITKVKLQYSGAVDELEKDAEGNIVIKTTAGNLIDHAPFSFKKKDNTPLNSSFILNDKKIISFKLPLKRYKETIIIDPWTTIPTPLVTNSEANDIDYDDQGCVYISGGVAPYRVAKYSNNGLHLWTYTLPNTNWSVLGTNYHYSKFCVLRSSGSVFIGEGINNPDGPRIIKLNTLGTQILMSIHLIGNYEIWQMFYNKCNGKLIGFGGGTVNPNNLQLINDTSISGSTCINFNGYTTGGSPCYTNCNDIACVVQDNNGDFYALMSSKSNNSRNRIQKSLFSNAYNPPCAFDVQSGYIFNEAYLGTGYSNNIHTVRVNALAVNTYYLYSFDGQTLKVWNKTNGALLSSVMVSAAYTGGENRANEGIEVDDCNNVYVGGQNIVHCYNFNGTNFIATANITNNINGYVRDIRLDKSSSTLYISGTGFATVMQSKFCNANIININLSSSVANCIGTITSTVSGGVPPYNYQWNTGATTSSITGLTPGSYVVTVTDNSCNINKSMDTLLLSPFVKIKLTGDTTICINTSTWLKASGATTYVWNPGNLTGDSIHVSPFTTTTYTCIGTSPICKDTAKITVDVYPLPVVTADSAMVCPGKLTTLTASGAPGLSYKWSTGFTGNPLQISSLVPKLYTVVATDTNACKDSAFAMLLIYPAPQAKFTASPMYATFENPFITFTDHSVGASAWQWNFGDINSPDNSSVVTSPVHTYVGVGEFIVWLLVQNNEGCRDSTLAKILIENPEIIYIPNAIDPSNADKNIAFFKPKGIGIDPQKYLMIIYDRWGQELFQTTDPEDGWNGKYHNVGEVLPCDVYVYYIKMKFLFGKEKIFCGRVTIVQ